MFSTSREDTQPSLENCLHLVFLRASVSGAVAAPISYLEENNTWDSVQT